MINFLSNIRIAEKTRRINLLISGIALLIACASNIGIQYFTDRTNLLEHSSTIASVIAVNSSVSLLADDRDGARRYLEAVKAEESIHTAAIYQADWQEFAVLRINADMALQIDDHKDALIKVQSEHAGFGHYFLDNHLFTVNPVRSKGELVGYIVILSTMQPIYDRMFEVLGISGLLMLIIVLIVYLLSTSLQRRISKPIHKLLDGIKQVLDRQDFSRRLQPGDKDEIGALTEGFNEMFEQIRLRDEELRIHRENLEADIKHRTTSLLKTRDAAEQANRAKSDFLATMSHEIRTPLNGVLGMTELLMDAELDMRSHRLAATAHRSADSLLNIINDILDFSKIESDNILLSEEDFDLREILEDTAELVSGQAHRKGLTCIADIAVNLPRMVKGDPTRLRQILVNLFGNAAKFTEKGEIRLAARLEGRHADRFDMVFEVSDTGPGISPEQQRVIFDAFSRADNSSMLRFGGTGLGLAITRSLVDIMQGKIELQSEEGAGSLFRLFIPFSVADQDVPLSPPTGDLKGVRVLIVDDHPVNREILNKQVFSWGMRNDSVDSGIRAIKNIRKAQSEGDPYRIVLLDWHMPDMDGLEVAKNLKEDEKIKVPPLVMLSSFGFDTHSAIARKASISRYLQKPVRQQQLLKCLREVLGEKASDEVVIPGHEEKYIGEILLVEDNQVNQEVALGMLMEIGCDADLARDGIEAVNAVKGKKYDLILMDCHMPEMNGFVASRLIREYEEEQKLPRTPIVAITADVKKGIVEECAAAGMDSYLSKPFKQSALAVILSKWLVAAAPELPEKESAIVDSAVEQPLDEVQVPQSSSETTILIVDDEAGFRLSTGDTIRGHGYRVIEASSGEAALALIDQNRPDLILLDAEMPGMDGFETCLRIRKSFNTRSIPVMMLTRIGDVGSVNRAFETGASDFIVKPVNYAVLNSRIQFQLRVADNLRQLHESQEWLAGAQRLAGIGYWRWDSRKDELLISRPLAEMLVSGNVQHCISLNDFVELMHPEDQEFIRDRITSVSRGEPPGSDDFRFLSLENITIVVHQELSLLPDSDSVVLGTVQDISERQASERRIRQLAYTDDLTGLSSRAYFYKHLEDVIKSAYRRGERFALLFLDLDGFKDVNDSLGHDIGDLLLKKIARRLEVAIREVDFVARLSGDEFCILIDNISDQYDAADVANRCLDAMNEPIDLGKIELRPRCSIGIANYPDDGEDSKTLLKAADSAMYAAKEAGKHRYVYYQPEFTAKAEHRLKIEQDLRRAVENQEMELYYQPQIDVRTGAMSGVEALLRWNHPVRGVVSPLEFIEIAERIGIIKSLGQWVLKSACEQGMAWRAMGLPEFQIAVNISPTHFNDPSIVATVDSIIRDSGFPRELIELEVTESVIQITGDNLEVFHQLKKMGVKIAIDDFGTGYSSLASLKKLPVDCLKIDRLFIIDMLQDPNSSILLGTIIGAARALGHAVVAEGVEEEEQVRMLSGIGCNTIQGYYFSRPVRADKIPDLAKLNFLKGKEEILLTGSHTK